MNRFEKIAARLAELELDAMLLTGEANRFYGSGFHTPGADGVALVTKNKHYYFTDSRYTEAAQRSVSDAEIGIIGRGKGYLALIEEALQAQGAKRVGFEEGSMTVREYELYREHLSCRLIPASSLLQQLRIAKDGAELEAIEGAQRIAERALEEILGEIRPGVTEKELAARLQYLMLHYGASDMSFDPIVVSGGNGSLPHGVPSEKKLAAGEFVTMDFGCVYQGYCSDMTRTVAVGYVTEEMERVYQTVLSAQLAGIAAAKAGVTGQEVDAAARKVIEEAGYGKYFDHSFGHGIGVEIHEAPNAAPSNRQPMPCGAVISAEPGIYIPGQMGVRIEDMLLLTEEGCRNLTLAKKELLIL